MSTDTLSAPPVYAPAAPAPVPRMWLAGALGLLAALLATWLASDWLGQARTVEATRVAAAHRSALVDRVRLADRVLRGIGAELASQTGARLGDTEQRTFVSITALAPEHASRALHGKLLPMPQLGTALARRLDEGESVLVAATAAGAAQARTILVRRFVDANQAQALLVAEIAPRFLWPADRNAADKDAWCLRDGAGAALHCSNTRAQAAHASLGPMQATQPQSVHWQHGGEAWDAASATLELATPVTDGHWSVLAVAPARHVAAGDTMRLLAAAGALAALLGAGALALAQRRSAAGLVGGTFARGAERRANSGRKALSSRHLAQMVERQKRVIHALTDIDQASLSRVDASRLAAVAAGHLLECSACDVLLVAILDRDIQSSVSVVVAAKGVPQAEAQHVQAGPSMAEFLALPPGGSWANRIDGFELLAPQAQAGVRTALLLPLYEDGNPVGIVSIGSREAGEITSDDASNARALVCRLGAALTSAARAQALYAHTHFDTTTALPNRQYLKEHLAQQIRQARRDRGRLAVLFVDLDGFKRVNASLGHSRADLVLGEAAARMRSCVREEDVVTRFGGDEFVVVLPRINAGVDARRVADKLLLALAAPFVVGSDEHHIGCSIGVSIFPDDAQSVDRLLRNADAAMFNAKEAGRGRYLFFDAVANSVATEQTELERDMRHALVNHEFSVAYQPQVDLVSGHIDGVEALVRWRHPSRGMVSPAEFIPLAERCGLIAQIGEFVMFTACAQFSEWEREKIAPQRLSVNLSGLEVARTDLVERVDRVLRETGLRPMHLELELTEGVFLDHTEASTDKLSALRARGVRIAIDDFGTGYSSLSYLQRLPIDVIKIDQSFVRQIGNSEDSGAIVKAILDVAHSLGKPVIAEGIETEQQRTLLAEWGCDVGQGYLWSRPLAAAGFGDFCRAWRAASQPAV